jgi:cyclic beta-1,2-glucan synthetase
MKVYANTVLDILSQLRAYFLRDTIDHSKNIEPFRSELYSSDQMDRHARIVARSHKILKRKGPDQLLSRLGDNEKALLEVRNLLVESIREGKTITPGGEWLLDNFYLIEEQIVIARKHLPKGYSEGLPYLASGNSAGMPRVYDIVLEIISHSDGGVDARSLVNFIASYQTIHVLTLGELWAIPIMLRLSVIENLRRVAGKIALDIIDHNLADYWADKMMLTVKDNPGNLILTIADMARSNPVLGSPFVSRFTRKLQGKGPVLALPLSWMEQQLLAMGISSSDLVWQENQKQAADQVSVSNSIGTLRFLGATDWREFVESRSYVEQLLRQDPCGIYPLMDFATRDRYRHKVEAISKGSKLKETEVAQKVLDLATSRNIPGSLDQKVTHVGYYLIDKGLGLTEQAVGMRFSLRQKCVRAAMKAPLLIYLFSIITFTLSGMSGMVYLAYQSGVDNWWLLLLVGLLSGSGTAQLSISVANWLSTILVKPNLLPRMDFSKGVPAEFRTMVVVPTMLSSNAYIEELIEALEIRYLANRESYLHFALLTDFVDASSEQLPADEELLNLAICRIGELNQKYNPSGNDTFFLFHRPRVWNAQEKVWMGYERKRGKLMALNSLIRDRKRANFSTITGDEETIHKVKYVITLDSDTQLPRETAWKIIATMAHPLNHPVYSRKKKRVTEGYGILQPRVVAGIPRSAKSMYLRMQGNVSGIDPYTRMSSDVYQDIFREGSFIGKGIYDVNIFEEALHHVFPDNRVLSHDLLEGCYTRSGLISDVLLYEENPTHYVNDIKRHHRWTRGDWQIGAWMLPFVTENKGRLVRNHLSILSRWKIFDNLRRSLMPISLLLLLLLGWTKLPQPAIWTFVVIFMILLPVLIAAFWQLLHKPIDLTLNAHLKEVGTAMRDVFIRFVFGIAVLPYEAYTYLHAIAITNWRMIFTRQKLLQWTPSVLATNNSRTDVLPVFHTMWIAPILAVACTGLLLHQNLPSLKVASPMIALWFLAPALAWRLSKPELEKTSGLLPKQIVFLHHAARKSWTFFEQFVIESENWLPPDNFQEQPMAIVAHRTSPTNMGMALLANLTSYDFGYITASELLIRTNNTLQTMLRLERHKGHFYNWYDTLSLRPLQPRYVSTVDSGNLSGHLLILRQGLISLQHQPLLKLSAIQGLVTTTEILKNVSTGHIAELAEKIIVLLKNIQDEPLRMGVFKKILEELDFLSEVLAMHQDDVETEPFKWSVRLSNQIREIHQELDHLTPWFELMPVPERFELLSGLEHFPSLNSIQNLPAEFIPVVKKYQEIAHSADEVTWLARLLILLEKANKHASEKAIHAAYLAELCEQLSDTEYDFLLDRSTNLLSIGFNVEEQRKDVSHYDLLASEARLGIFAGIAQGKLPQDSWFALGRLLTNSGGDPILLSWSGSMFEYLMPQLVMPTFENTLLSQTCKATVKRQIEYGQQRGIPWGISESGYNTVDANMNYQYRAFGVPGLGLKRGLEEDLVVAPYASMMALMVSPGKACANLQQLSAEGFEGGYGYYEAIDYTSSRLPRGKDHSIVQSYMVHHQGMSFLSLAYVLLNKPMQQRFNTELRFQATLLLLQERIPRATLFYAHTADIIETHAPGTEVQVRNILTPHTPVPEIQMLSNGRYQLMVTNTGGGYSRWKDITITRWREDATLDNRGIFCYIKDISTGKFWSNTYQPTLYPAKDYEAVFSQGHIEFKRKDYGIITRTEIVVSPEDDTEMRRVRLTNKNTTAKVIEITSYAEIVLAVHASDESHPAFSNLFVQTEIVQEHKSVFATRRARSEEETPPWMFHHMHVHGAGVEAVSFETDRMQFTGRGRSLVNPLAMDQETLAGNEGAVLDPILSIRYRIILKPNQTAIVDLIYGITETRESCETLMHKYRDHHLKKRAFELSWTHSQVLLRQINATESDVQLYDRLASSVIHPNRALRAETSVIKNNFRGQSGLWSHSVSGDLPIVLLHIHDQESLDLVRQMIQAHAYWRLKGLEVDLVIWNEDHGTYRQVLQENILGLITAETASSPTYSKPGNIYVKSVDQLSTEDRILFESVARLIIHDNRGTLSEQINKMVAEKALPPLLEPKPSLIQDQALQMQLPDGLLFYNGNGGFTPDGKEYKILIHQQQTTPLPWVNVLANATFGTVVSESGSAYTWAENAHEYRLTPWSNDPVSDSGGEAFYLRDEETGSFWSPSPFPASGQTPYLCTHGFGYSLFEHDEFGIFSEMSVFVDKKLPVKYIVLKLKNHSGRSRKLSLTGFLEIILGDVRSKTNMHIFSEQDIETGALLFRNRYNAVFSDRVSFFQVDASNPTFTTDRAEFIGRNRNLQDPQAMYRKRLSGRTGAAMDACAALQVGFELLDDAEKEIVFTIGSESNARAAIALVKKLSGTGYAAHSLQEVIEFWKQNLGALEIQTPDMALNLLANGWLAYQTLSSRIFARTGFYQSSGAFGFRDQLQDMLALLHTQPEMVRGQILLSASRQFAEGDVQHWWHPPEGRGVRTRCSDDMLWLPYVVSRYIKTTNDKNILDAQVGYLESRILHDDEDSFYDLPVSGMLQGTLYEHCVRAINHSLSFGKHGLPLIGSGDWNDGMDRVGNKGRGESIWLGFFLFDILQRFSEISLLYNDLVFADTCIQTAKTLQQNLEKSGWDGQWYLRAFFDDGTPLGSKINDECRIDAIAQSWSVLSGAGNSDRQLTAMASLDKYLVNRNLKLIQLLDPPFDTSDMNPGYIKGYVPGVRENGGQYSHAAIWALMAFAELGDREKVWELFSMVHPIGHANSPENTSVYKVEPYVMAADVYANETHKGRGGWTWYTGSSGWMYQFITNSLIGLNRQGNQLNFKPCFPLNWPSVSMRYTYLRTIYQITIFQLNEPCNSWYRFDGIEAQGDTIALEDDGIEHQVEIFIQTEKKTV